MSHWDTVDVMISLCDGPNPWRACGSYVYVHPTKRFLRRNCKCFLYIMVNLPKTSRKLPNLGQANHCRKRLLAQLSAFLQILGLLGE